MNIDYLIIGAGLLFIYALIVDMFGGVRKKVDGDAGDCKGKVEEVGSNIWGLSAPRIDEFGWIPIFKLPKNCVFIVEAEPKGNILGMIKGALFKWNRDNPYMVRPNKDVDDWRRLYSTLEKWGSIIRGSIIQLNRYDTFIIVVPTNIDNEQIDYIYEVNITATITNPIKFYTYLKSDDEGRLKKMFEDYLHGFIIRRCEEDKDFKFNSNSDESALNQMNQEMQPDLNEAGYKVIKYTITYQDQEQ